VPQAFSRDTHIAAVGSRVSIMNIVSGLKPEYSNNFSISTDYTFTVGGMLVNILAERFYTMLNDVFVNGIRGYNTVGGIVNYREDQWRWSQSTRFKL
jgi:outer membrane receptor for ferrienterochelin and colicins